MDININEKYSFYFLQNKFLFVKFNLFNIFNNFLFLVEERYRDVYIIY